ncbi:hypothetical protein QQS21_005729 [Conoideocrella luteorostrata]|uniref:Thioesterase n=1 Tax=Conoideocrella luteorostrata TaxID=1105319 RepID=A0AAJ0FYX3_9HYPO|nr:hypothetical protein QQS21_005729 [Conoideocrella luteorostrata]
MVQPPNTSPSPSRLAQSAYNSPYSHVGAPSSNHHEDPFVPLRSKALATLEAMGYAPNTMVERGVLWGEDQDPFGHVMHTQYMHFLGVCFHRVMESYDEFLSEEEYDDMIHARGVVPVIHKYELNIKRQVKYPDSLIAGFRQEKIEPTRNIGITSLYSLKQQRIVAEVKGWVTYVDMRTGKPVDIRTLGGGWARLFDGFTKKSEKARELREAWEKKAVNAKSRI